ncbi:hypothetical protein AMECASPLE_034714 [Ameca splendens]|uniref:Uncharacterized protein n=1 Tax=Ameca splendens TaxID=208324 RepID=A0ABV1A2K8_9TELE
MCVSLWIHEGLPLYFIFISFFALHVYVCFVHVLNIHGDFATPALLYYFITTDILNSGGFPNSPVTVETKTIPQTGPFTKSTAPLGPHTFTVDKILQYVTSTCMVKSSSDAGCQTSAPENAAPGNGKM